MTSPHPLPQHPLISQQPSFLALRDACIVGNTTFPWDWTAGPRIQSGTKQMGSPGSRTEQETEVTIATGSHQKYSFIIYLCLLICISRIDHSSIHPPWFLIVCNKCFTTPKNPLNLSLFPHPPTPDIHLGLFRTWWVNFLINFVDIRLWACNGAYQKWHTI